MAYVRRLGRPLLTFAELLVSVLVEAAKSRKYEEILKPNVKNSLVGVCALEAIIIS